MSAFVVSDKTINSIVTFLATSRNFDWLKRFYNLNLETDEDRQKFGESLFKLNCDAVNQRYPSSDASDFRPLDYEYKPEYHSNCLSSYKALRCLIYQCSEGDVVDSDLYKKIDSISASLAHDLVRMIPGYEALPWN